MRGLVIILFLTLIHVNESRKTHGKQVSLVKASISDVQGCEQKKSDCEECLSRKENCSWCANSETRDCREKESCPLEDRIEICRPAQVQNQGASASWGNYDKTLDELQAMDQPVSKNNASLNNTVVTMNASVLCSAQGNCDNCTAHKFCFWCESTRACEVHVNSTSSKHLCPQKNKEYYNQCFYPIGVTPCEKRKNDCKGCLRKDHLCYWCATSETCAFYPAGNFQPKNCPRDKWYHKKCPMVEDLLWVLLPILAIILIPVIIYLIIWLICCCMRAAGYEPLQPVGAGDPDKRKHPKGIRLKPGSPTNKTDQLREKYGLGNP